MYKTITEYTLLVSSLSFYLSFTAFVCMSYAFFLTPLKIASKLKSCANSEQGEREKGLTISNAFECIRFLDLFFQTFTLNSYTSTTVNNNEMK